WREHVDAMQQNGLSIDGIRGPMHLDVRALHSEELDEPIDLAFVAVKSHHTDDAIDLIQPHLTANATVVSLQNGFNAEKIAAAIGRERVIGTVPDYTAALVDPGRLEFTIGGPAYIGELDGSISERVREVERLLAYLTTVHVTANIVGRIWTKQCYMSQIVMTALVNASVNEVIQEMRYRLLGVALVREAISVADAAGVTLERDEYFQPEFIWQRSVEARQVQAAHLQALIDHFALKDEEPSVSDYQFVKLGSGMWWDIVYRRRRSETAGITGGILERAHELRVPTPLNSALVGMITEIEDGSRQQSWDNLDELAAIAEAHGEPLTID
ncbi:MAG TPA: 2-dehydropantoate 2-reductase N-terminal domain-containing protein, partial [Nitrolancea sp.]|nr:2-dehydropantoate 2-reductase N-terminal domain-containing protein [Nitrolancea sp.]